MRKIITTTSLLLALAALTPAAHAGDYVCDHDMAACVKMMKEELDRRGWVGIEYNRDDDADSPRISRVLAGSPAAAAGLEEGDVMVAFDGIAYADENADALKQAKRAMVPGREVTFTVLRDGRRTDVKVTLGAIPEYILAQWVGQHVLEHHLANAEAEEVEAKDQPSPRP